MKNTDFKTLLDWLEKIFKIWRGSPWGKAALILIFGGVLSITGTNQYVISALAKPFGIQITIPETAPWISFALIGLGILVLVLSHVVPDRNLLSGKPNSHDVALLKEYRSLATKDLVTFLTDHNFRISFRRDVFDPIETLAYDWKGAHNQFQDSQIQAALANVRSASQLLCEKVAERTYPDHHNPMLSTPLTDEDLRVGIQPNTIRAISQMNDLARSVAAAMNDFETAARQKIPT